MKKFYLLTKTLLAAAMLGVGQSAWAGNITAYSNTDGNKTGWTSSTGSLQEKAGDGTNGTCLHMYYASASKWGVSYLPFAIPTGNGGFTVSFNGKFMDGGSGYAIGGQIAIYSTSTSTTNLQNNSTYLGSEDNSFFYLDATKAETGSTSLSTSVMGGSAQTMSVDTWYTYTISYVPGTKTVTYSVAPYTGGDALFSGSKVLDTDLQLGGICWKTFKGRLDDITITIDGDHSLLNNTAYFAKVATFDFTTKNSCNVSTSVKTSDVYFGFSQSGKNIRYQFGYDSTESKFYNGLTVNSSSGSAKFFNIVDGYCIYNQNSAEATITYKRSTTPGLITELVYRTGNSTNTAVWGETADSYRYGGLNDGAYTASLPATGSYEGYTALNVYAPIFSATVQATIGEAGVATYCAPCALNFSGVAGLIAYTATVDGSVVKLTQVDNVPANTGVILKGAAGTYTIPAMSSSSTAQGALTGVNVRTVPAAASSGNSNYVLSKEDDVVGFYVLPTDGAVQACRTYLVAPTVGGSEARGMRIVFADDITGISEAAAEAVAAQKEGKFFKDGKFFIVKNGKKFNANGTEIK